MIEANHSQLFASFCAIYKQTVWKPGVRDSAFFTVRYNPA